MKIIDVSTGLWSVELADKKFRITLLKNGLYEIEEFLYPKWEYLYIGTVISFDMAKTVIASYCYPNWLERLV